MLAHKKERERAEIDKIISERSITTDTTEIQKIIRDYSEQININKLDNLEAMDKFLEIHKLSKLSHKKIGSWNRLITNKEIESVMKNLPTINGQMVSLVNSIKHLQNHVSSSQTLTKN